MSTPATTQASQGVFSFDRSVIGLTAYQTIFTLPNIAPALIEAVYFEADPSGGDIIAEALVLQIVSPAGVVVFAQATPIMDPDGTLAFSQSVNTWARGATGVSVGPAMVPAATDITPPVFNSLPLPEMVMPPLTTIQVALYEDQNSGTGTMILSNIAVTYTANAGPVSSTVGADVTPFLLSTTNS